MLRIDGYETKYLNLGGKKVEIKTVMQDKQCIGHNQ